MGLMSISGISALVLLPLQIIETRYLDMLTACMRSDSGFGVVMIREGQPMLNHRDEQLPSIAYTGTLATLVDFDQGKTGALDILFFLYTFLFTKAEHRKVSSR